MPGPLNKETVLDVVVNLIPMAVLGFFAVLFLVDTQWRTDPFTLFLTVGLVLFPLVLMGLLTYEAAVAIEQAESEG